MRTSSSLCSSAVSHPSAHTVNGCLLYTSFTHYGDANTLRHYFDQTNTEDELTSQLLSKMGDFSEAISLSSRGLFQSSVEGIDTLFTNIANRPQDNSQFELGIFQLMRNKIQESLSLIHILLLQQYESALAVRFRVRTEVSIPRAVGVVAT